MYCVLRQTNYGEICSAAPFATEAEANEYIAVVLAGSSRAEVIRCNCQGPA